MNILIWLFTFTLLALFLFSSKQASILEKDRIGLAKINDANSTAQRVVKFELDGTGDDYLMVDLYYLVLSLYPFDESSYFVKYYDAQYFTTDEEMFALLKVYADEFNHFAQAIETFKEDNNRESLFWASERYYEVSIATSKRISIYLAEKSNFLSLLNQCILINAVILVLLLLRVLVLNNSELAKNKKLSLDMNIDIATGVYNHVKCNEILDCSNKYKSLALFRINDLQRISDSYGQVVQDILLFNFAQYLKMSTRVTVEEAFITRYSTNEFVVYFSTSAEKEILLFLEEMKFFVNQFNELENANKQYKLSFGYGYSTISEESEPCTLRTHLIKAEEFVQKNKTFVTA
ncbi:MAG: diguanylate cyclase [Bacillota bacterium]